MSDAPIRLTRRSALAGLASACAGCLTRPASQPASQPPSTLVSGVPGLHAARDPDFERAFDAVLAASGFFDLVSRGDTVLLKVNTNSGDPYPFSTNPALVSRLARALVDKGAHVLVGDRSFYGDMGTRENLEENGIAPAARAAGAEVVVFDDPLGFIEIPPEQVQSWVGPVRVPALCREAHVVNLAVLKTHFISGFTLSLKNLLGTVKAEDRAREGNLRVHDPTRLHKQIAEIASFVRPVLHLLDGHSALVSGGPTRWNGSPQFARPGLLLASSDPVAVDWVGATLLHRLAPAGEAVRDTSPDTHPMLEAARALGLAAAEMPHPTTLLDKLGL
ncbi:MAG: DUF362 domain-containing protein [Polyangiaceae bacterium]